MNDQVDKWTDARFRESFFFYFCRWKSGGLGRAEPPPQCSHSKAACQNSLLSLLTPLCPACHISLQKPKKTPRQMTQELFQISPGRCWGGPWCHRAPGLNLPPLLRGSEASSELQLTEEQLERKEKKTKRSRAASPSSATIASD